MITAQEILVDNASYPTPKIAENSRRFRPLGLGYANLGALLMACGLPYDSDAGRDLAAAVTALMSGTAYAQSARIAAALGPFDGFAANREPMLGGAAPKHRDARWRASSARHVPPEILAAARRAWDEAIAGGERVRRAQQPDLGPRPDRHHRLHDGLRHHRRRARHRAGEVQEAGRRRHDQDRQPHRRAGAGAAGLRRRGGRPRSSSYIDEHDTIEGAPGPRGRAPAGLRLRLPAARRRALDPLPGAPPDDGGGPAVPLRGDLQDRQHAPRRRPSTRSRRPTSRPGASASRRSPIYRDGCKRSQPLSTGERAGEEPPEPRPLARRRAGRSAAARRRLPDERQAITHKFSIDQHEGYITVGLYEDGQPGEIFLVMAKEGSTISGLMDCFATTISIALQYGVPLKALVDKFTHTRFEPCGLHRQPADPDRQVDHRLHLPLAGVEVPRPRGAAGAPG